MYKEGVPALLYKTAVSNFADAAGVAAAAAPPRFFPRRTGCFPALSSTYSSSLSRRCRCGASARPATLLASKR